jgi:glycosyltransferase involved in cell wall biosynthesis
VWEGREHKWAAGPAAALRLAVAEARLLLRPGPRGDAILVGYPGHLDLVAARRAARGAPVVFSPLVSLWDTLVGDRARFRPGSPAARTLRGLDRRALRAADLVVADTEANADFLARLAGLPRERVAVCLVGAEERLFTPGWDPSEPPIFIGKLIPLHGLETVLEAVRGAPDLGLRVVGSGQLDALLERRPENVEWIHWLPYEQLPGALRSAACALGIFGAGEKARRVIPNKAFQALACGVPLVTGDTPAARELLVDGESALLVPPGDAEALAGALRRLRDDPGLAVRLSEGGLAAYRAHASEEVLGERWRALLQGLLA